MMQVETAVEEARPNKNTVTTPHPATKRWAIVGGGMLGLTLAYRLAVTGRNVTLIESSPTLGGLAGAWTLGDIVWDRHYHVTLLSDMNTRAILRELDLEREIQWVETQTGFYSDGKLHPLSNALDYLTLPALGMTEKARLAGTILYGSRLTDWQKLEQIPVTDWLKKLSGESTFERLWLPLLRAKLGDSYEDASAAFIWATIRRLYAARRTGLKKEMFGYVPGGYARVLQRFEEVLDHMNVGLKLGRPVESVQPATSGLAVSYEDGTSDSFDRVIMTLPPAVSARVCRGLTRDETEKLSDIKYQGIVCASLLLDRPLGNYYLTYLTDQDLPFTTVVEMSTFVDPRHFNGNSLVYLPRYLSAEDPFFALSNTEIRQIYYDALSRMYPSFHHDRVRAFRVSRVREVFPLPTLGYSKKLPPATTTVEGLHVVNSAHIVNGTLNVNDTVGIAEQAATSLIESDGRSVALEGVL